MCKKKVFTGTEIVLCRSADVKTYSNLAAAAFSPLFWEKEKKHDKNKDYKTVNVFYFFKALSKLKSSRAL